MKPFRIVSAGDAALTVEFEKRVDPAVNARAIAVAHAIQAAAIAGVRDVVPTFRTVTVFFDPLRIGYDALLAHLEREATHPAPTVAPGRDPLRISVCYGDELGPDLAEVAAFGHLDETGVVRLHTARPYRVFMLGFLPGFAYLGLVDPQIAAPRRSSPRMRVPRGAVGIAGIQTGVYPADTPGGWQLIGRTPLRPFDPGRGEPFLMKAGDAVQFYAIDRREYDRLRTDG